MENIGVLLVGLSSGFLSATVGGGGMVSIPFFIFLGFSPKTAVATTMVGDIAVFAIASFHYAKSKLIQWRIASVIAVIALLGAYVGTSIMLRIDAAMLQRYIGIVLLLFLPLLFLKKDFGIESAKVSLPRFLLGLLAFFLASVNSALVPAGGATLMLLILIFILRFELLYAYATICIGELVLQSFSGVVYIQHGYVQLEPALIFISGSAIGSWVGVKSAIDKGNLWLKKLLMFVVLLAVLKILVLVN